MEDLTERIVDAVMDKLAGARVRQGLTLQELADKAGTDRSYIGLLEHRKRRPTLYVALRIANALGQDLPSLIRAAEREIQPKAQSRPRKTSKGSPDRA